MNLSMKSAEYQALMKEMGYTNAAASSRSGGSPDKEDVFLAHVTLRLDDDNKIWQKLAANLAAQWLELGREVVQSVQVVAYATAACLLLHGAAHIVRVVLTTSSRRNDNKRDNADETEQEKE